MSEPLRYLSNADVSTALPTPLRAVELAGQALRMRAHGAAQVPPKPAVTFGDNAFANAMPVAASGLLGCKWITLVPANASQGLPTANGLMIVSDAETGLPVCLMAAGALPLDYASSIGARLASTCTVWSDDVEQFAAVAPAKLGADYPLATDWVGRRLPEPNVGSRTLAEGRPMGRLLCQNLGNAASDIVVAAEVAATATARGLGQVLEGELR